MRLCRDGGQQAGENRVSASFDREHIRSDIVLHSSRQGYEVASLSASNNLANRATGRNLYISRLCLILLRIRNRRAYHWVNTPRLWGKLCVIIICNRKSLVQRTWRLALSRTRCFSVAAVRLRIITLYIEIDTIIVEFARNALPSITRDVDVLLIKGNTHIYAFNDRLHCYLIYEA